MSSVISTPLNALLRGELAFLKNLLREQPAFRPASGIAGHVRRRHGIGQASEQTGRLAYTQADFEQARHAIAQIESGQAVAHPDRSHARTSPRIACLALQPDARPRDGYRFDFASARLDVALGWDTEILVVTETLEQLEHVGDLGWLQDRLQGRSCIAVCAGTTSMFPKAAATALLQQTKADIWAFCDYTPSGLAWAASLPRLDALAFPSEQTLRELVTKTPVPGFLNMMRRHVRALACEERSFLRQAFIQMQMLDGGVLALDFPADKGA